MPDIHGNIEGIRKSVLDEMKTLYDLQLEPDVFLPQKLLKLPDERICDVTQVACVAS